MDGGIKLRNIYLHKLLCIVKVRWSKKRKKRENHIFSLQNNPSTYLITPSNKILCTSFNKESHERVWLVLKTCLASNTAHSKALDKPSINQHRTLHGLFAGLTSSNSTGLPCYSFSKTTMVYLRKSNFCCYNYLGIQIITFPVEAL